jgi:hypothetical protein
MIHPSIPRPHQRIYGKTRQADCNSFQLKEYLVCIGLRVLTSGDMARVKPVTQPIRRGDMSHE